VRVALPACNGLTLILLVTALLWAPAGAAQSGASGELRHFFEALDEGAPPVVGGWRLHRPDALAAFYRDRAHAPLWVGETPARGALAELVLAIVESEAHGFQAANYHGDALMTLSAGRLPAADLTAELLATDAFFRQAHHRAGGAVFSDIQDPSWHLGQPEVDPAELLERIALGETSVTAALEGLWPDSAEYRALVAHRAYLQALGDPPLVRVPEGPLLRPGLQDPRVVALKERLLGPGEHDEAYDDRLRAAVIEFQRSAGLDMDALVGPGTLSVMNTSRFSWIDRLDANLERWRWLPRVMPETYVRVNTASFTMRVIERGEDVLRMNVIVGQPYRQTPTFAAPLRYMVFNPFWNLPRRIAVQDKLPQLRRDPTELALQGYEARRDGETAWMPVDAIDWTDVDRASFHYQLRQRPGPANALGRVKFMLPNEHAVYLHDTPARDLFARAERVFSSGCVRLAEPFEFARWLLEHDGRSEAADRIPELVAGGTAEVIYLTRPVPTFMVYFTAIAGEDGEVSFRRDLYERDAAIVAALRQITPSDQELSRL
jgi:L,D-transpeptidase YcbB